MENRERYERSKQLKQEKDFMTTPSLIPLMWTGCYTSCVIFTVCGLLFGGATGVFIALLSHFLFWLLIALLHFILFLHES